MYGGAAPGGFDCSGFTTYVFSQVGVSLPHGATSQLSRGTEVSRSDLQPGDLVFFSDGSYPASHVGIYVGDGWMLHCGDPISYANLNTSYWQSHFYAYGKLF